MALSQGAQILACRRLQVQFVGNSWGLEADRFVLICTTIWELSTCSEISSLLDVTIAKNLKYCQGNLVLIATYWNEYATTCNYNHLCINWVCNLLWGSSLGNQTGSQVLFSDRNTGSQVLPSGRNTESQVLPSGRNTGIQVLPSGRNTRSQVLLSGRNTGSQVLPSGIKTGSQVLPSGRKTGEFMGKSLCHESNPTTN